MSNVNGIAAIEQALQRLTDGLQSSSGLGTQLLAGAQQGAAYAAQNAPRRSGALARSFRAELQGLQARVFIDPGATSSGGGRPAVYGAVLEARGYAFFSDMPQAVAPNIERTLADFVRRLV